MLGPIYTLAGGIPISAITAEVVAQAFVAGWVSRFGIPSTIITDRGQRFESELWSTLMRLLGTKRSRTTAYHRPQYNGMVERFHRQLKASLKAQNNPSSWMDSLPLVLLGIKTALKEDTRATAAEMVYGTSLRLPGEFFTPSHKATVPDPSNYVSRLKSFMQQIRPTPPRLNRRKSYVSDALATCTHVFVRHDAVRKPLQAPYDGPYPVLQRKDKYFILNIKGQQNTVSKDRLKPAYLENEINVSPDSIPKPQTPTKLPTAPRVTRSGRQLASAPGLILNVKPLGGE